MEQLQLLWELQEIEREIRQKEKELQNLASVIKYKQQKTALPSFLKKKITEKNAGRKKFKALRNEAAEYLGYTQGIKFEL